MSKVIILEDVVADLERIQNFDAEQLVRRDELGAQFAFEKAVEPANKLIGLFQKLPKEQIDEFPPEQKRLIQNESKNVWNLFEQIQNFNARSPDPEQQHTNLLDSLSAAYQPSFDRLYPLVSFSVARTVDFNRLSEDGRIAVQSVRDETAKIMAELKATSENASSVLQEVRDAAAKQGVSQQAKYFKEEANFHAAEAEKWLAGLFRASGVVLAYGVLSLFFRYIPFLSATNTAEAVQLTVSKILVFFILAFVVLIYARNYNAHKHNSIINKHRQNALMTFTTLAEAGSTHDTRDTVLHHAAAAIYAPNDTGYLKNEERGYSSSLPLSVSSKLPVGGSELQQT